MYLSEHELNAILQTPYYSQPYSTSFVNYTFYRGRYNANVLTVRFNVQNDMFNETFIQGILLTQTEDHYCAAKALFSCPAIISQRLESRIISNEPLENTEEESKII